jgi:hypothetical protein
LVPALSNSCATALSSTPTIRKENPGQVMAACPVRFAASYSCRGFHATAG